MHISVLFPYKSQYKSYSSVDITSALEDPPPSSYGSNFIPKFPRLHSDFATLAQSAFLRTRASQVRERADLHRQEEARERPRGFHAGAIFARTAPLDDPSGLAGLVGVQNEC